ncbi:hypothetical protein GCM10011511_02200 [Puia dinghuensis]|uniref:YD repeat-containing protein n=1 Tax=Puia dinghuensis TaxID=1792502 RepID=A0A8J2XQG3_9BACT|nr:hypothetical protein GCM10011511_02200 [Puia dinghuensis]
MNLQTGAAQVSIPLYSYSDPGNRLGLTSSLAYVDGNGMKVSEMASQVGTGWQLDCGGTITRVQHGEPDDQKQKGYYNYNTDYLDYMLSYYPNGYMYSEYSPSDNIDDGGGYSTYKQYLPYIITGTGNVTKSTYRMPPQYLADREQDVFAFTFNGRSGEFIIGRNKQVRILSDSKLQVSFVESDMSSSNIRTTISSFTITDEAGIQYVYRDLELGYVCTYNDIRVYNNSTGAFDPTSYYTPPTYGSCTSCPNQYIEVVKGRPENQFVVNKWYLSQIINPLTGKSIGFNYDTYEVDVDGEKTLDYSVANGYGSMAVLWQKHKAKARRLLSVNLSTVETLNFQYSTGSRVDISNEKYLSQVQVVYNGNPLYSWNFGYGYFVGIDPGIKGVNDAFTAQEQQWSRLCLQSLQKTGSNGISEPAYAFQYNLGNYQSLDRIPPMFSIYQDHFGYYNAAVATYGDFEPGPATFYNRTWLVTYLQNQATFKVPSSTTAKNGILSSITYPMGGALSFSYEPNYALVNGQAVQMGGVRVNSTTQYDGIDHKNDIIKQYNYVNADGSCSGWGNESFTYAFSKALRAWNCGGDLTPAFSIAEFAKSYAVNSAKYELGLTTTPALDATLAQSFGTIAVTMVVSILVELLQPDYQDFTIQEYRSASHAAHNPLPMGYKRVEVVNLLSTDNIGKSIYDLTGPDDHAFEVPALSLPYSDKQRCPSWVYGLPKAITVQDKLKNTVKQTVNHYNFIVNTLADNNFLSKSWTAVKNEYACSFTETTADNSYISQETYYPLTGHTELTSTDEYTFNSAGQSTVVTTNFEYDANYQLKHKYATNSKGEKVETFYYHPYDYTAAHGAIGTMNAPGVNIISPVVSAETYINKSDGNSYLVSGTATDFDVYNGDVKPKTSYAFQGVQPVLGSSLAPFNTSSAVRDQSWFKQISTFGYDNFGNLAQMVTGGNKIVSTIYDYNGKLPVATAVNAAYNDIDYSSFEADGGKPGSWVNAAAIVSSDARTGNNSFNLSDPSNAINGYFGFSGLNSSLTYVVSYWSKNGSACISGSLAGQSTVSTCQGSSGWRQGSTVNGWTYYEVQVSNLDKISVSGTGLLDEFRVYPVGAQMTTTTYSPLVGKTSECDVSGRVTYYWYDELGRLIKVSDDQRNVIRTYEYNYKQ